MRSRTKYFRISSDILPDLRGKPPTSRSVLPIGWCQRITWYALSPFHHQSSHSHTWGISSSGKFLHSSKHLSSAAARIHACPASTQNRCVCAFHSVRFLVYLSLGLTRKKKNLTKKKKKRICAYRRTHCTTAAQCHANRRNIEKIICSFKWSIYRVNETQRQLHLFPHNNIINVWWNP